MRYLLIAEKASLMRDIQACYKAHYQEVVSKVGEIDFIALAGHVCTNFEPIDYPPWAKGIPWSEVQYPMIPDPWQIKPIPDQRKQAILEQIRTGANNYDGIIVGTDSDQEGYGIYYLLQEYLGLGEKKTLRFMEHSLTDKEILKSLLSMTDFHTDPVHQHFVQSFLLRSRADWLYGMNITRIVTYRARELRAIGRVKSPTIMLVYNNSKAIDEFSKKKYFHLIADYGTFNATYVGEDNKPIQYEKPDTAPQPPLEGVVEERKSTSSSTHAPQLYDLTAIQAAAGQQYGYSPQETLEIVQALYESHKLISYPRTQCQYVSSEKAKEFPAMLHQAMAFPALVPYIKTLTKADIERVQKDPKVVNDAEIAKESHDALLPTDKKPDLTRLNEKERVICEMIYRRMLAQFLPQCKEDKTTLILKHGDCRFQAQGKIVTEQGWRALYKESKDAVLPDLKKGDAVTAKTIQAVERQTKPPRRLTQATLINAMENIATQIEDKELKKSLADSKGIGTPATRAAIIADILARGYIEEKTEKGQKKPALYITEKGKAYIESLEGVDIVSPIFAARIDTEIKQVQRGEREFESVYRMLLEDVTKLCRQAEALEIVTLDNMGKRFDCPHCQTRMDSKRYNHICSTCGLKIPKILGETRVSDEELETMLSGEPTSTMAFTGKEGKEFHARLKYDKEENKVVFLFGSGITCPKCGAENMRMNRGGLFCDCGVAIYRKIAQHNLTDNQLKKLATTGKLASVSGFISRKGEKFSAGLKLNGEFKTEFVFEQKPKEGEAPKADHSPKPEEKTTE